MEKSRGNILPVSAARSTQYVALSISVEKTIPSK